MRADLEITGAAFLNRIPGAVGVVKYGDTPAPVPQSIVDALKKRLSELAISDRSASDPIRRGTPVRIIRGPLAGTEAIFDSRLSGSERVRVLLCLLDRQVKVCISKNAITSSS